MELTNRQAYKYKGKKRFTLAVAKKIPYRSIPEWNLSPPPMFYEMLGIGNQNRVKTSLEVIDFFKKRTITENALNKY